MGQPYRDPHDFDMFEYRVTTWTTMEVLQAASNRMILVSEAVDILEEQRKRRMPKWLKILKFIGDVIENF